MEIQKDFTFLFSIPHRLPTLNNELNEAKKHWAIYAKHKKNTQAFIAMYIQQSRIKKITGCNHYQFIWKRRTFRGDLDNMGFAVKYIFDTFKVLGIIDDDNTKRVAGITHLFERSDNDSVSVYVKELSKLS